MGADALVPTIGTAARRLDRFDACAMERKCRHLMRDPRGTMHPMTRAATESRSVSRPALALGAALLVAVGIAWWMTGAPPESVDSGLPTDPPPMALPEDLDTKSGVAIAAGRLATGRLEDARTRFIDEVAERPDDVVAQTGLILSRWRSTGPRSVERDLAQLAREYPEDAFVAVHLGLVQTMLEDGRVARTTLTAARDLARRDDSPTGLRLARLADDVMHPGAFRGYLPVLVRSSEVATADRGAMAKLLAAVERDDRAEVGARAKALRRSSDPMSKVAGIAGAFTKEDPIATARALETAATAAGATKESAARARFLAGLARAWSGRDRELACEAIEAATGSQVPAGTRLLAAPVAKELCSK